MNETAKKGLLIAVIVLAVAALFFTVTKYSAAETPVVVKTIGGPVTSEKEKALAAKASGAPSGQGKMEDAGGG